MKYNKNSGKGVKFSFGRSVFVFFLLYIIPFQEAQSQNVLKGPYLIEPGITSTMIRWEMDKISDYTMEYRLDKKKAKQVKLTNRGTKNNAYLYEAKLTGLQPNSIYYYRLVSTDTKSWYKIRTYADHQENFSFVAMGDSRSNHEIFSKIMTTYSILQASVFLLKF